jgi:hypothetical protein
MKTRFFAENDLSDVLREMYARARQDVETTEEDYLLNVSENDFTAHLVSKYTASPPRLSEPVMLEPKDVDVDISNHPIYGAARGVGSQVRGYRVDIHIPFAGNKELFSYKPSTWGLTYPEGEILQDQSGQEYVELTYSNPGLLNPADVKMLLEHDLQSIRQNLKSIEVQCNGFNSQLEAAIRQFIRVRKDRILTNRKAALNIGLPLKRRANAVQTYIVPDIKRKPEIQRPTVNQKNFVPEPVLIEQEYENILAIIRNMVSVMERSPKAFINMGEEDRRSHFLVQLNGQYQGRATGETFNFQGKTDILIREDDRNVFISECKIWTGEAGLLEGIDQILGYLHWRDTKTALLIFNRNKSFSEVLGKVKSTVQGHACCKKLLKQLSESEWRFLFRNPDDANRELQLAVLCFDVPKEAG